MSAFGEIKFESSGAFADDEEEEAITQSKFGLETEWTEAAKQYFETCTKIDMFCGFAGKIALGVGEGFCKDNKKFTLLGKMYMTGSEETVDICSLRRTRKSCAKIYLVGNVVLFLVDFYGVPRFLTSDMLDQISDLILVSKEVVMFHSDTIVSYRYESDSINHDKLYYLASGKVDHAWIPSSLEQLNPPNIVSGPSASILMFCERMDIPALLVVNYSETELLDSISLQPLLRFMTNRNNNDKHFNVNVIFSNLKHTTSQVTTFTNLYT